MRERRLSADDAAQPQLRAANAAGCSGVAFYFGCVVYCSFNRNQSPGANPSIALMANSRRLSVALDGNAASAIVHCIN
jgi:hypothetical protein